MANSNPFKGIGSFLQPKTAGSRDPFYTLRYLSHTSLLRMSFILSSRYGTPIDNPSDPMTNYVLATKVIWLAGFNSAEEAIRAAFTGCAIVNSSVDIIISLLSHPIPPRLIWRYRAMSFILKHGYSMVVPVREVEYADGGFERIVLQAPPIRPFLPPPHRNSQLSISGGTPILTVNYRYPVFTPGIRHVREYWHIYYCPDTLAVNRLRTDDDHAQANEWLQSVNSDKPIKRQHLVLYPARVYEAIVTETNQIREARTRQALGPYVDPNALSIVFEYMDYDVFEKVDGQDEEDPEA